MKKVQLTSNHFIAVFPSCFTFASAYFDSWSSIKNAMLNDIQTL